jgi:DNA protecting protein DprA
VSDTAALTRDEAFARIRLLRSPNIGPVSYTQLFRRFGTASAALDALPDLAARGGAPYRPAAIERIEAEVAAVRSNGARYLFHDSPDYPALLATLESPPPILTLRGDSALLSRPSVAVVGARNASAAAVKLSRDFATALAGRGYVVVSGLARGIDSAAHRGAIAGMADGGGTIGVIASGIDITYPPENAELQEQVASQGLLIAEMPPGTEPLARHFPHRNRMQLVIVESPAKAKTIEKYLGKDYKVLASYGHVRDLPPKDGLSVRPRPARRGLRDGLGALWRQASQVKAITDAAKGADRLILATDPDREGEAISWHVRELLAKRKVLPKDVQRVTFNAITKQTVTEAMSPARARSGSDRRLSGPPRARLPVRLHAFAGAVAQAARCQSAGRVQSVALRLICEREREIEAVPPAGILVGLARLEHLGTEFSARLVRSRARSLRS